MQNKAFRFGPNEVQNSLANIFNPGTCTGGVLNGSTFTSGVYTSLYVILRHIRITNNSATPLAVQLFVGASAAGATTTEFAFAGYTVPANGYVDWYGYMRLDVGDFLTGFTSVSNSLTIIGEGEIGVA